MYLLILKLLYNNYIEAIILQNNQNEKRKKKTKSSCTD